MSQFHQESLEEEGCHSARSSPDSRWRRLLVVTAARKSDRSRNGAFLPDLSNVRHHCPWYLLLFQLVNLDALQLGPANFELRFTKNLVSKKTIVNSFVMFFLAVNSFATLPRVERRYGTVSVLQVYRAEHHGVALS